MTKIVCEHIKAKGKPSFLPLAVHLQQVASVAEKIASKLNMNTDVARCGALLHDIGKTSPIFQKRLFSSTNSSLVYRHEIGSLFFLSLLPTGIHEPVIEMVVAHHKSIWDDARKKGILDLDELYGNAVIETHLTQWESWHSDALKILISLGFPSSERSISRNTAIESYKKALHYCEEQINAEAGYSKWRGLMNAADYFASAFENSTEKYLKRIFCIPNLSFFNREHQLYPLSQKSSNSKEKHTIVIAPTGAGKTDYLFRRTQKRVFYTLPFQASINAMFERVKNDLKQTNPRLDIRLLHSASRITISGSNREEKVLQNMVGSAIKILTPHQLASIIFGTSGYEATIIDLQGNDVILDEIHTYNNISRSMILKIVEVLNNIGCRIHIGTATIPSALYRKILGVLGDRNVLKIRLSNKELDSFNRHIIRKIQSFDDGMTIIQQAVADNTRVLVVSNRVEKAQEWFAIIKETFKNIPILLIHSRFKRDDRNKKEHLLLGLDEYGSSTHHFNTSNQACIVVATQVVEVSLDISFDLMITETAPLDSLIQRFGRINRIRTEETVGNYKPVYIIAPPHSKHEALPYDLQILQRSFEVLPDNELLKEEELQDKIDAVFPSVDLINIDSHAIFNHEAGWTIDRLTNRKNSILFELLDIESVASILESDVSFYMDGTIEQQMLLEIPVRFWKVKKFDQLKGYGNDPFIVPDEFYSEITGLHIPDNNTTHMFI